MAVALKSSVTNRRSRRSTAHRDRSQRLHSAASAVPASQRTDRAVSSPTAVDQQVVKSLPHRQPLPTWLKLLLRVQQTSSVLMLVLVAGALAAYGWTVYIQQHWGQEYRRLESLKKQERQLVASNEALKNQMARQAETPSSGLMVPDPSNTIFLAPAPPRPPVEPETQLPAQPISPAKPLGY